MSSWTVAYEPTSPAGSAIAAATVAPESSDVLVALSALGRVDRIGTPSTTEVQLVFDVTSFAAVGSRLLAATGNDLAPCAGSVYERLPSGTWRLARDGSHRSSLVAALGSRVYVLSSDEDAGLVVSTPANGSFTDVSSVSSFVALAAAEGQGRLWIGGRSTVTTSARLFQGTGVSFAEVALPAPRPDERHAVTALACANDVVYVGLEATNAQGTTTRGLLLGYAQGRVHAIAELDHDAATCMTAADGTIYLGTRCGKVLWLDEQGHLRDEGVPSSAGVATLLANGRELFAGVRGATGAKLLRRAGAPAGMAIFTVAPSNGPTSGGTTIRIQGQGFANVTAVTIGGAPLGGMLVTPTEITGTTPPHAAGRMDVVVVAGANTATLPNGFTYGAAGPNYAANVKPILDARCVTGHGPGGAMSAKPLTTYAEVMTYVTPGSSGQSTLFQKVNGGSMQGYAGGSANVALIKAWIDGGASEN